MARESKSVDLVAGRRADDECRPGNQLADVKGRKSDRNISKAAPSPGRCSHVKRFVRNVLQQSREETQMYGTSRHLRVLWAKRIAHFVGW